jgi:hypothetical protein
MAVVRSSVYTDWEGSLHPRRLLITALNKVARDAITDLDKTVFPFFREHAHLFWSGVLSAEKLTLYPKRRALVESWAAKYRLGPPKWLYDWIEFTLHAWLATDERLLLVPDKPAIDSFVLDLMDESQTEVLNVMRDHVTKYDSGELHESELVRLYGQISMDLFSAAMRRSEAEIRQAGTELRRSFPTISSRELRRKGARLSFTPGHAEAAVRYQVLGQSPEGITGGGRGIGPKARLANVPVHADPSNLYKMIREFLKAVEIEPRPSRRSKR